MPRSFSHQRAPGDSLANTLPNSVKGALVALVLVMLGLLFWQLYHEVRQSEENRYKREQEYAQQLAAHMGLGIELRAHAALALLKRTAPTPVPAEQLAPLLDSMHAIFPALDSLIWLDARGRTLADTQAAPSDDAFVAYLLQHNQGQAYQYVYNAANEQIYALLAQPPGQGYWVARIGLWHLRQSIRDFYSSEHRWQLEDPHSERVFTSQPAPANEQVREATAAELRNTVQLAKVPGTDMQLRSMLDKHRTWTEQLSSITGKFLLFIACALLTLLALIIIGVPILWPLNK